ncbi:hypothetical protein [Stenoxybacter acetivorans]|uniref:hypothetical protein n=1 Tax=Stenoxybacter acetivorans TaxID=422441 RepID=UPI00055A64A6|nr:hypothetical protein [Stenoxybacter acetivorans]
MMDVIFRFFYRIFFEHVSELLPYEKLCLGAWRALLSAENKDILDRQIESCWTVRRYIGKLCFHHSKRENVPLFANFHPDQNVALVVFEALSSRVGTARIFIHRGLFFSIENSRSLQKFIESHKSNINQLKISRIDILIDLN